mgnify:CR=1 FL=1
MNSNNSYAIVLGGGGSNGAYQIGVWKALKELKIKFHAIIGNSVGALNATLFIQNEYEDYIATNYDAIIPATITPVTFLERYGKENEEVRPIKVLRPEVITQFDKQFKRILSETSGEQVETVIGSGFGDTSYTSSISAPSTNGGSSSSSSGGGSSY